jgi:phage pi2 protein 07
MVTTVFSSAGYESEINKGAVVLVQLKPLETELFIGEVMKKFIENKITENDSLNRKMMKEFINKKFTHPYTKSTTPFVCSFIIIIIY